MRLSLFGASDVVLVLSRGGLAFVRLAAGLLLSNFFDAFVTGFERPYWVLWVAALVDRLMVSLL